MKVIHISYSDKIGGAAIAAYRHHEAMRMHGIDSQMLVAHKTQQDANINELTKSNMFIRKLINRVFLKCFNYYAVWSWNHFGYNLLNNKEIQEADVIYLHWINNYTLSLKAIERILKLNKPVYWFMHDMWPITGGCHYALDCEKFTNHCYKCPMGHNKKGTFISKDLSYIQFNEKIHRLSKYENLHFIAPSIWLAKQVKKSSIFKFKSVILAQNVLNTDVFVIRDQKEARKRLNLPIDKKLILFGADNLASPYKGWQILREALEQPIDHTECVIYGADRIDSDIAVGVKINSMGKISDIDTLIDLYNACDIFVTPTLADNYPNVVIEAQACGLPVIATPVGGVPEMILNGVTGYIIDDLSPLKLRESIVYALSHRNKLDSNIIRQTIVERNSYSNVAKLHPHLF